MSAESSAAVIRGFAARDAERAVKGLLTALGVDTGAEGLRDTPGRVARSLAEQLSGCGTDPAVHLARTFPADGYEGIVLVSDIPLTSLCEHHLLPFVGVCHCAYIPGERIVGLSKFARVVDGFARRPQVQERLTHQITECLQSALQPAGLFVFITAEHTCMSIRGVQKPGTRTVTSEVRGLMKSEPAVKAEVLEMLRERGGRS